MKLVMVYSVGDGFTFSCEETKPLEYESVEKAELDFLELCEKHIKQSNSFQREFSFAGHYFYSNDFYYGGQYIKPEFYTLEDWWEDNKGKT